MPKPEDIEVIIKRRPDWDFLQKLPKELHGFTFKEGGQLKGHELVLGSYVNEEARRRLELIYTKETFDYVPVRQDVFAEWITGAIDRLVGETTPNYIPRSGHLLKEKGILDWCFPDTLPERIGNFVKFIGPRYPLDFINNATVILDYADFDAGNELVVLYNRVRNEFYAENKKHLIPNTIHEFDAKKLEDLEMLLAEHLEPYLLDLGSNGK